MACVSISREYPYNKKNPRIVTVTMTEDTVLSIIYLNKLYIPDVLIDLIKDYLYVSKAEVIMNYCKKSIIASFGRLSVEHNFLADILGRRRQAHVVWTEEGQGLRFQQFLCVTCGEESGYHLEESGCCPMEWDGEEGTLMLTMEGDEYAAPPELEGPVGDTAAGESEEEEPEEDRTNPYEQDDYYYYYDGYDSDNSRYGGRIRVDSDDDRRHEYEF